MAKTNLEQANQKAYDALRNMLEIRSLNEDDRQALRTAMMSLGSLPQVIWERDTAKAQLEELGYSLGEAIRPEDKKHTPDQGNGLAPTDPDIQPKLQVYSLIIETTRRCNMACPHCLRGDAQNWDINSHILKPLFARISHVTTLTFSGGEPSLNVGAIWAALEAAKWAGTMVDTVYIVTNGKHITRDFTDAVRAWHRYCLKSSYPMAGDASLRTVKNMIEEQRDGYLETGATVAISMDKYHGPIQMPNFLELLTCPNVVTDKLQEDVTNKWVIGEGNGESVAYPSMRLDLIKPYMFEDDTHIIVSREDEDSPWEAEEMYVNAKGHILKQYDFSYEHQDEYYTSDIRNGLDTGWLERLIATQKEYQDED